MWEISQMLERYELDLVLMNSASVRKDMEYQVLFEEELLIAVPRSIRSMRRPYMWRVPATETWISTGWREKT